MDERISVIIPTHYRNDVLPEAIESVAEQEYEPVELIVVDDSGEGHAEPVLEEYSDVIDKPIVREENGGWAAAYTTGIEASTGEYIQLLDDDDRLLEGKLEKTAAVLRENPDVGVSYCGVMWGEEPNYPKPEVSGDILEHALRFQTFPLWTGSLLMEREVLLDCMPLAGMAPEDDLDIELGDTDLKIELARRTKVDYVDEILVFYRRDNNKLWTGLRKFKKVKQNVRHQEELYAQYPEIRRDLLSSWYERQGNELIERRAWSPTATLCFLKSLYYADSDQLPKGIQAAASVLGRPGLAAARRARDIALGRPQGGTTANEA
ncbi:glycosyltransferase [Halovenus sp. WSH3]|uniref:Glycosyltransferase n=1 Tax=Halovenus carboxidivorans TaxID=2692199 RepID=A0A6B0T4G2_9EURY|nr:glycosyltransferase family 2 protein [Halovenus carboxidivorans]MXR53005.1 glycosyltransferase [Halovenus carboxidivorans]